MTKAEAARMSSAEAAGLSPVRHRSTAIRHAASRRRRVFLAFMWITPSFSARLTARFYPYDTKNGELFQLNLLIMREFFGQQRRFTKSLQLPDRFSLDAPARRWYTHVKLEKGSRLKVRLSTARCRAASGSGRLPHGCKVTRLFGNHIYIYGYDWREVFFCCPRHTPEERTRIR